MHYAMVDRLNAQTPDNYLIQFLVRFSGHNSVAACVACKRPL